MTNDLRPVRAINISSLSSSLGWCDAFHAQWVQGWLIWGLQSPICRCRQRWGRWRWCHSDTSQVMLISLLCQNYLLPLAFKLAGKNDGPSCDEMLSQLKKRESRCQSAVTLVFVLEDSCDEYVQWSQSKSKLSDVKSGIVKAGDQHDHHTWPVHTHDTTHWNATRCSVDGCQLANSMGQQELKKQLPSSYLHTSVMTHSEKETADDGTWYAFSLCLLCQN